MAMLLDAAAYMLPLADEFMAAVLRGDNSSLTPLVGAKKTEPDPFSSR